jgi:hypothetical protein
MRLKENARFRSKRPKAQAENNDLISCSGTSRPQVLIRDGERVGGANQIKSLHICVAQNANRSDGRALAVCLSKMVTHFETQFFSCDHVYSIPPLRIVNVRHPD